MNDVAWLLLLIGVFALIVDRRITGLRRRVKCLEQRHALLQQDYDALMIFLSEDGQGDETRLMS